MKKIPKTKTHISIDTPLLDYLKGRAEKENRSVSNLIETLIKQALKD